MRLVAAQQAVEPEQENHGGCGGLDTAAAATRVCADEHDNHEEEERTHAEGGDIYRVEARRAAGERHEGAGFQFLPEVQTLKGVAPLAEHEERDTHEDDNQREARGDVRMQRHLADGAFLEVEHVAHFGNREEAEAAREGEHAGGDVHERVQLELHERIGEQRETHVTEGTDRLEKAAENAVVKFHTAELREVDDGTDGLEAESKGEYCLQDAARINVAFLRVVRKECRLVVESRVHARKQDDHGRNRHDSKTARLHQENEHPVAEGGEACADVDRGKAGDAYGGHRREEGVEDADGFTLRKRERQEECSQGNQREVARHDHQDRVARLFLDFGLLFHEVKCFVPRT